MVLFRKKRIFFHLSPISSHFHPLQAANCYRNSRLVVDEVMNDGFVKLVIVLGITFSFFRLIHVTDLHATILSLAGVDERE